MQNQREPENVDACICIFSVTITYYLFVEGRLGSSYCLHPILRFL